MKISKSKTLFNAIAMIVLLLCLATVAHAQTGICIAGQVISPPQPTGTGQPVPGAVYRVCAPSATGTPCFPLTPAVGGNTGGIFSDPTLLNPIPNPGTADQFGNFNFCSNQTNYLVQTSPAPNITYSYQATVGVGASTGTNNVFTGVNQFSGIDLSNTLCTGALSGFIVLCGNSAGPEVSINGGSLVFMPTIAGDISGTSAAPIVATTNGVSFAPSATTNALNASNISSGTLPAARLPNPSASTLGGIESFVPVTHEWINQISTLGVPSATQPACGDLSNAAASCATDATNATNITSGTLPSGRLPTPTASTLGGVESLTAVTHNFLTSISTAGVPTQAQPVVGDIIAGLNAQCIITSGGVSTWGACSGTSADTILTVATNTSTLNGNTSAQQNFSHTFTPSGSQIPNTTGSKFRVRSAGTLQASTTATTLLMGITVAGGAFSVTTGEAVALAGNAGHVFAYILVVECTNTSSATYQCTSDLRLTDQSTAALTNSFTITQFSLGIAYSRASSLGVGAQFSTASTSNSITENEFQVNQLN